jgi:uncharacterized protein with gpF-like domain
VSAASDFAMLARLPPADAIAYMLGRADLTVTHNWQDLWQEEHARQFTVSRLARLDLLQSIHDSLSRSVAGDLSCRDWMRDTEQLQRDAGWWGEKQVLDPATGEMVTTRFNPARLALIYDTNTRQAAAAGQWDRIQRTKRSQPYLRYVTMRDDRVLPMAATVEAAKSMLRAVLGVPVEAGRAVVTPIGRVTILDVLLRMTWLKCLMRSDAHRQGHYLG